MANRVTIDVEARLVDGVSRNAEKISNSASKANKELDKLGKKNVKARLGADDHPFTKKIREAQQKADKFGKTKASAVLGAIDKASSKIGSITGKASAFASKVFRGAISVKDTASPVIGSVTGAARAFAGKTFSAAVKIIDYATTPLRKIKESLFSIKSLVMAITAGFAAKQFVMNPINLADQYSSAQIGFSTLLGATKGQEMMDDIDAFAKATPFKTSGIISNVQKMMAYGWDASRVIQDMETIGDAAAATGKGDEGLESIVYALSEIRSKGKLSTQELNQLASAGIKAKQYLAQGLGYGTDDEGMAKLMEDLEDGAVGANQAIELILQGMEEFDGMMDKTANETAKGLWSQIEDTFEINIFRRWGQGLQDGAKKGLGYVVDLLNSSEDSLVTFGDLIHDIGKEISNWGAEKLGNFVERVQTIVGTSEFKNASLGGKIKLLWKGTIMDPLKKWWNSDAVQSWIDEKREWLANKMEGFGEGLGRGLSNGLLAILGVDVSGVIEEGADIGASFGRGFAKGFDGSAVTDALVDAIKDVWGALPGWAKVLLGGYAAGKVGDMVSGIGSLIGGGINTVSGLSPLIGSTGNAMVRGTGLLSGLASAGYAMTGGAATSTLSGGMAALAGGAGIAGAALGAYGLFSGGKDIYTAYKSYKAGDTAKMKAYGTSGGTKIGGTAAGAAIGTLIAPGIGTAIGAGIGYLGGKFFGDRQVKNYEKLAKETEKAKYSSQAMKDAIEDGTYSAEEMQEIFADACWENLKDRFGDIELSMKEINALAKHTVYEEQADGMDKFAKAAEQAEASLNNFKSTAEDMERLNFDMTEHRWKMDIGIAEKLSEEEIEEVKARVQNFIDSAEAAVSDSHYKFNASVQVLLTPKEGEKNETYESIITTGNTLYAKLQTELESLTKDLTAKYNLYLEDGVIDIDEQGTLSRIQAKIAEIIEKVSNAQTEAEFTVKKMKFTMGDLSAESWAEFETGLSTQMQQYIEEQEEALTFSISQINLALEEGTLFQEEYDKQLQELLDGYNSNIDSMTARVEEIKLEGISEAFDDVGTVDELQTALDELLAEGKNPVDVTFEDINAHLKLKEDALSEEDKATFTTAMKSMLETAASGENALKTTAEVDPQIKLKEDGEGTTSTNVLQEALKSKLDTALTGDNAINANADLYISRKMYGSGGTELSEEANAGRGDVQTAVNSAFTNSFSATANVNVTANYRLLNPTATLNVTTAGQRVNASLHVGGHAKGGFVNDKILSWLGEEGPESVIPLVPGRRARALRLWEETGKRLGVQYHAEGGIVGGNSEPIKPFAGNVQDSGEKKIEINMGGVTIEIKTDGNKSIVESIEDQEEEIANKVAAIFKNVFSAQFANTPVKGGA